MWGRGRTCSTAAPTAALATAAAAAGATTVHPHSCSLAPVHAHVCLFAALFVPAPLSPLGCAG